MHVAVLLLAVNGQPGEMPANSLNVSGAGGGGGGSKKTELFINHYILFTYKRISCMLEMYCHGASL